MSNFSEKCKELLAEKGYTVYQLSTDSNLDRTTVQRMITGKRLPSMDFITNFCDALALNPQEKEEVLHLFNIEKYGREIIDQRLLIKKIFEEVHYFEGIQTSETNMFTFSEIPTDSAETLCYDNNPINNRNRIIQIVEHEYRTEDVPFIYSNIPTSYTDFFTALTYLAASYQPKKMDFYHLLSFYKNNPSSTAAIHNLSLLKIVLPFMQNKALNYMPYCNYTNSIIDRAQPFPYYVITHSQTLWLSEDFKKIYCVNSHVHADFLQTTIKNMIEQNFSLFYSPAKPEEALNFYIDSILNYGVPTHSLEYCPCFSLMQPRDLDFSKLIVPEFEIHEELRNPCAKMLNSIVEVPLDYKLYCIDSGAEDFFQTGQLSGAISLITKAFPKNVRKTMVENFYSNALTHPNVHVIDSTKFAFPKDLHIDVFSHRLVAIYTYKSLEDFSYIEIKDPIICNAILDFVESLEYSSMTMPRTDMLNFLKNMLIKSEKNLGE